MPRQPLPDGRTARPRGQMLVLFALSLSALILSIGLVVDGGNALVQRRGVQNAADFGALAGARIVAEFVAGDTTNGVDANVQTAIRNAVTRNGGTAPTFTSPNGPRYVDSNGGLLGFVGASPTIPNGAAGVTLATNRTWRTYFLGTVGMSTWTASANATAMGGYSLSAPPPGSIFPVGISLAFFQTYPACSGPVSNVPGDPCYPQHLTPGNLNVPGGFGWLKFGCDGYGLGQDPPANIGGCSNSKPFLQDEIGPPSQSFGCCTQVGLAGSADLIGSLPGNKASADCDYWITNQVTVIVPIWDTAGGTGQNAYYHIVGFAGFQLTNCDGGKDIEGVWRRPFFTGPTTTTPPGGTTFQALGVQLVR